MTYNSTVVKEPAALAGTGRGEARSPWDMAARRFWRNRLAVAGLVTIVLLGLACFGSIPWTVGHRQTAGGKISGSARYEDQMELKQVRAAPTGEFWMGTDALGRDLRARFLLGGAISLAIGMASAIIAVVIGTGVGLWAGYVGGRTDAV